MTVAVPSMSSDRGSREKAAPSRVGAIDVVRGAFMLLIVLGHSANNLDASPASRAFMRALAPIVEGSTVGFTVVSGVVLAILLASRDLGRIVARYRTQGLRLLFVAHPAIAVLLYGSYGEAEPFWQFCAKRWYLTDSLAVLCALVVPFVPRLTPRARIALGAVMLVGAKLAFCTLTPHDFAARVAAEALLGTDPHDGHRVLSSTYGVVPLGGMFLVGLGIGDVFGRARTEDAIRSIGRRLAPVGAMIALLSVPLVAIWAAIKLLGSDESTACLRCFFYPQRQLTLFPFWCGMTTLAFGALAIAGRAATSTSVARVCELLGRCSLFAYVFQYLVAQTVPRALGWDHRMSVGALLAWVPFAWIATWAASSVWARLTKKL